MKQQDRLIALSLFLIALVVWFKDLSWMTAAEDTLPILIALPLAWWLGRPWNFKQDFIPPSLFWMIASIFFFFLGFAINITFFLGLGWTLLLWSWLKNRIDDIGHSKLLVLVLMAFPWVTLDAERLSWAFRLSGATTTAALFSLLGFDVAQQGTLLLINTSPISVEAACAGMNTLQSMLIAGAALLYLFLKESPLFWWNVPFLIAIAWAANTLRIITITAAALLFSPEFALGAFHTLGGWLVICFMFLLCWLSFSLQEPKRVQN